MGTDQGLKEYPEIFKKYFGTVVPPEDNKFSALNAAVWSGGSFVYVPPGVDVPLPLQAYFRINGENTGQFERTLIVVDEGASVHYIEGCTAPLYATDALHVAVVEVIALPKAKVRYTTIQNWSNDVYNLVTKRAHAHEDATVEWIDANTGSRLTMKYPSIYLRGKRATADIISVAVAGKDQHQDTGAKAVHLAADTKSRIVSKSVSKDGGRTSYRGQLKVAPGATNVVASVRCDALMLDDVSRIGHLSLHRHPGRRHLDVARGDGRAHQPGAGLLPDEPRPDRERGPEPHRAGLPGGLHQGAPDGVRHRVQPPGQARDGGRRRVTASDLLAVATEAAARQLSRDLEEPDWLLDERLDAVRRVAELPDESNTLWTTYLDLRPVRFEDVALQGAQDGGHVPREAEAASLPEGAAALINVADGRIIGRVRSQARGGRRRLRGHLRRGPAPILGWHAILRAAIESGGGIAENDRFGQVSRAIASVGVFVHVPDGVELAGPIVVRWSMAEPGRALVSRTVIVLGERARAGLLEELEGADAEEPSGPDAGVDPAADSAATQSHWWGTSEVILGDGAALDLAGLQDFDPATVAFVSRTATTGRDAALTWALAHVGGAWSKSRIDNHLVGQGSSVHQAEIAFGGASQVFDLSSYTRHVGTDTTGDLLSKGVFQDRARAYIKGLIRIDRSAHGTDSYLGEFGMLLAKKARSVTIPSLEIDQPDVRRASHASSVAPIDESQVFYAMTPRPVRRTRRARPSRSPSSSRSSPASHCPTSRSACASDSS